MRVAVALIRLTTPKEIYNIVSIEPSSKFENYSNYNSLIRNLAKNNGVESDQIEMYLFNQDFK